MTKNKFANPPYLEKFDKETAWLLRDILFILKNSTCKFQTVDGAINDLNFLIKRSSLIRECDLYRMKDTVKAINELQSLINQEVKKSPTQEWEDWLKTPAGQKRVKQFMELEKEREREERE